MEAANYGLWFPKRIGHVLGAELQRAWSAILQFKRVVDVGRVRSHRSPSRSPSPVLASCPLALTSRNPAHSAGRGCDLSLSVVPGGTSHPCHDHPSGHQHGSLFILSCVSVPNWTQGWHPKLRRAQYSWRGRSEAHGLTRHASPITGFNHCAGSWASPALLFLPSVGQP